MKLELTLTKHFGIGYRKLTLTKAKNFVVHVGHVEVRLIKFHTMARKPMNIIPMLTILESNPIRQTELRVNNLARI